MPHHQQVLSTRRAPRGQALVLAALSLLLLALTMALSFNLSHALRGKTRLQQHSDALAYSMATIEARSLNYFAVSNRAIASSYVAMNSLHASMAAASVTADMLRAGAENFQKIAAQEFMFSYCSHCGHGYEALRISSKFNQAASDQTDKIRSLESSFNKAVDDLSKMMDGLHDTQQTVFDQTSEVLSSGSAHGLSELKKINGPLASELNQEVGGLNAAEYSCAIDGMECRISGRPANTPRSEQAKVLVDISNASRTDWIAGRSATAMPSYLNEQFIEDLTTDIQGVGRSTILQHRGTAKTVQQRGDGPLHEGATQDNTGKVMSGHEHGQLFSYGEHIFVVGISKYGARVSSDAQGGEHTTGHDETHDKFEGTYTRDLPSCLGQGHCFMKFRADPNPSKDFGQPPVYSYVTQQLRESNLRKAPWQLNDSARFNLRWGPNSQGTLQLAAGEGAGLSKALVYYHRLGAWQEPPNLFNPFWRAKLHPFSAAEAASVLDKAGNADAARLASTARLPM